MEKIVIEKVEDGLYSVWLTNDLAETDSGFSEYGVTMDYILKEYFGQKEFIHN